MQSLQKNVHFMAEQGMPYDNIFVWNAYLTEAIRLRCNNTIWTIALVHGDFKQVCDDCFVSLMVLYLISCECDICMPSLLFTHKAQYFHLDLV